ncbi:MAG TPA: tRNA pseudouridine(55) synthase TruB [Actinomycetes bacterium]|nr:tRNA pseudouridine(55) synthase TruB [Actinomycetes bacterium]
MATEGARSGLVVVDKPSGWTSHDVVARVRRLAGTRRVGHAGTLDPMATGVLVLGLERATKLLGHLALRDKAYDATLRLGVATTTDDAEGEVVSAADASGITEEAVRAGAADLTGALLQVPSAVSAIKVDGVRAYARVRAGESVELSARPVTVTAFDVLALRPGDGVLDVDVHVECSTGTYVRALARDLGTALRVGGHLTALRRTRVGEFGLDDARTLDQLERDFVSIPLEVALGRSFPRRDVGAELARAVTHGGRVPLAGETGPTAVYGPDGTALALMAPMPPDDPTALAPLVVLTPA